MAPVSDSFLQLSPDLSRINPAAVCETDAAIPVATNSHLATVRALSADDGPSAQRHAGVPVLTP